jgi:hypothetical protein
MARKILTDPVGVETAEKGNTIFLKVNRSLTKSEHDLLMKRMEEQERLTGMKIIVIPFSVDHVDGEA